MFTLLGFVAGVVLLPLVIELYCLAIVGLYNITHL